MTALRLLVLSALAACTGTSSPAPPPAAPEVPLVAQWPEGARCRVVLAPGVEDTPEHRTALLWWREALRQSVRFAVTDGDDATAAVLELTPDAQARTLAATWRDGARHRPLAGASWAQQPLPAALDALAWATRLALGEAAPAPVPIARGTSPHADVVRAVDDARALQRDGGFAAATRILRQARARDGAAPFVLEPLAALELLRGDLAAAERIAREAIGYDERLLPDVRHRLGRTLLLARASASPEQAARHDQELLTLARAGRSERPHDVEPVLSEAIARNFLGEFAAARTLLEELAPRLPEVALVDYHLGWACLGAGDAAAAVPCFERAAARLPDAWVLLPRAIALYESGRHDVLRQLLQNLRESATADGLPLLHDVLRLQAAHALLTGERDAAARHLAATLTWLWQHPLALRTRVGEFAEQGALLIRLGGGDDLPPLLAAVQQQHPGDEVADVCAFLGAMLAVRRTGDRQPAAEATLAHGGDSPWALLLAAYAHERRGEVADMQQALERAARLASSPMTKALLARGLAAAGRSDAATTLRATLRAELRTVHLRRPCRHPLLGPELAFACSDA